MNNKKFYLTTPIYYPSANFHIGHCYTTIIADAIARYKRLSGYDVFYLTGTDEHGQKIQQKAAALGITPKEHVDKVTNELKAVYDLMNISYDRFIRTTDADHEKLVQKANADIYRKVCEEVNTQMTKAFKWWDAFNKNNKLKIMLLEIFN